MEINIFWFRRDLRLHDNHGLFKALSSGKPVLPIFIYDDDILDSLSKDDRRIPFIYQQLQVINEQLKLSGSGLLLNKGKPLEVFKWLATQYSIATVFTNEDYEPYAIQRDKIIAQYLASQRIQFRTFTDHVIFKPGAVVKTDRTMYEVYSPFRNRWKSMLKDNPIKEFPSENIIDKCFSFVPPEVILPEQLAPRNWQYEMINHQNENTDKHLLQYSPVSQGLAYQIEIIKSYQQNRDYPYRDATTRLGVHLRFGTISIRQCVIAAIAHSETWLDELIWREFFIHILSFYPYVIQGAFKKQYNAIKWNDDQNGLIKWTNGLTGYPLVDAGMRELNATGFMHNRVRMVTASFLVKHLLIDWRLGEAWFAEKLLDFELASNNGNWQWAAGTGCDAAPYFRIFNPLAQQKRFDPTFEYIRKWVPEFGTAAYPKPIVEHTFARERCLQAYKKALNA